MADADGPTADVVPLRRPARRNWLSQWPITLVLIGVGIAMLLIAMDYFRRGSVVLSASVLLAGRMLARHLWRTQLGNQRVSESDLVPGSAWLWPRQARDLVADYELAPLGFA